MTTVRELLEESVRGRYSVEGELGQGGMATVYLGLELGRRVPVAIKVMHPKLVSALGAERFRREVQVVSSMAHPHIVPLIDSGVAGELLYYIMPYLEGESLFDRLQRERRLPLDDALRYTHQVASALGYAHARGVLHRDVKPENILLAGGSALVSDFGLARAIGAADYQKLTQTGVIVGTPYYMSPNNSEDLDLDQRVDTYGLGGVLYEMITGGPPFTGPSLKELVTRILRAPVPLAGKLQAGVPPAVDAAIGRALAKTAAARFTTMQEFASALPQPAGGSTAQT